MWPQVLRCEVHQVVLPGRWMDIWHKCKDARMPGLLSPSNIEVVLFESADVLPPNLLSRYTKPGVFASCVRTNRLEDVGLLRLHGKGLDQMIKRLILRGYRQPHNSAAPFARVSYAGRRKRCGTPRTGYGYLNPRFALVRAKRD